MAIGALFALMCCLLMLSRIGERLVVSVDGFDLRPASSVTVGSQSDICYDLVPHDFLTIRQTDHGFEWTVSKDCLKKDSLCYFKINNHNPNLHPVSAQAVVSVDIDGERLHEQLTGEEVRQLLEGNNSHYVMLRNVLEKRRLSAADSQSHAGFKSRRQLRSFFYRSEAGDDDWQLMILDRYTTLRDGGETPIGYALSGSTTAPYTDYCKIQFYRMAEYSYQPDRPSRSAFMVGDVCYLAKPLLVSTEWGAGHVMVRTSQDGGCAVRFAKPVTYTEHCDTLRSLASGTSHLLTIQQFDGSFPVANSLYVPPFSSAVQQEVCNISVTSDSIMVDGRRLGSGLSWVPTMSAWQQPVVSGAVHMRAGLITMGFACSYLWLPILVALIIILAFRWAVSLRHSAVRGASLQTGQLAAYFTVVALIALAYMACKMLIAIKLSFTYPYFEKITGVIVVSAALTLLLFYQLSALFNHAFLTARIDTDHWHDSRRFRRWGAWVAAIACLALCGYALIYMDQTFNSAQIASYLPGEVFSGKFWQWDRMNGVTDTHRSVPYTLLLVNVVVLAGWLLCNIIPFGRGIKTAGLFHAEIPAFGRWARSLRGRQTASVSASRSRFARPEVQPKLQSVSLRNAFWEAAAAVVSAVGHSLVPCVLILLLSVIPGNYATAFITVGVVLGMSWSLTRVDFSHGSLWAFFEMFVITLLYLLAAIVLGDKGYLTNYLGFVFVIVLVYLVSNKGQAAKHESRWMMGLTVGAFLFALFIVPRLLPLKYDVEEVSYDRAPRRFEMFSQFEKYMNSGYRYAVADAEFMTVLTHYMYNADGSDPLSPERHILHPSVSTGQSPVVLNDVSAPAALFGAYGWMAYIVYFLLPALLLAVVGRYSLQVSRAPGDAPIDLKTLWRMIAVMMWVGTTLYLYASYVGWMPFTGRLNPGLGVDAVGEALESAALLAFMTATSLTSHQSPSPRQPY